MFTACFSDGLQEIAAMVNGQGSDDSTIVGAGIDSVEFAPRDLDFHARLLGSLPNFPRIYAPTLWASAQLQLSFPYRIRWRHVPGRAYRQRSCPSSQRR